MIVALDVGYDDDGGPTTGLCGVVAFEDWVSAESTVELTVTIDYVRPYVSGRLFERELPCLIAGLDALARTRPGLVVDHVLVDGNVRLDNNERAGLGLHLFRELGESIPVIGVAKTSFKGLAAVEVVRGASTRPLYVTAAGMSEVEAAALVRSMAGNHRLPALIRRADQLSRQL